MEKREISGSFAALGLERIVSALADRANTPGGRETVLAAVLAPDRESAEEWLNETAATIEVMEVRPDYYIEPCEDVTGLVVKAGKSVVLAGEQLRLFIPLLENATRLNGVFSDIDSPRIDAIRMTLPEAPGLADLIKESIDEDGRVKPTANPEIERLNKSLNSLRKAIREKAENLLRDEKISPMLQDDYVTLRDNRFVLPIKAEHKSHVEGIIHDSSNTGQTFYIEPKFLVDLNNRLRTVEMELAAEEAKLLRALSVMVAEEADAIGGIYAAVCRLDAVLARARLSRDLGLSRPAFGERLNLKKAAHPIMLLDGKNVVRNDVSMPEGARALIISGPNTGGKTVALTTIGLTAAMARMGLYIPAEEGSETPFYNDIHADIGDSQSIADDLSTFSGHLKSINEIVRVAGPGSIALLDELMISTDPKEGSALAVAVVENLVKRNADVIVTTHFHELKIMAQTRPELCNVSMEFDTARARPTYYMISGAPGESSALAVAEKLELDAGIISAARARLEGSDERVERTLAELRDQKKRMENARRETERVLADADRIRDEAETLRAEAEKQRAEIAKKTKRKLAGEIADARRVINALVEEARAAKGSKGSIKKSSEKLDSIAKEVAEAGVPDEKIPRDRLTAGDQVYIIPLESKATLTSDPASGKAEVSLGAARMTVSLSDLVGVGRGSEKVSINKDVKIIAPQAGPPVTGREINILGMRAEAGVDKVEKFLDQVFGGGEAGCRIIHGKGTGALKAAVHEYLAGSPYVESFETAGIYDGGDGATIVTFRK